MEKNIKSNTKILDFDKVFIEIIRLTIRLDSTFNVVLKHYYEGQGNEDFEEDILKNRYFELAQKGYLVYTIAKRVLPAHRCKGLKAKIYRCTEIKNMLTHQGAVKEGQDEVGYLIKPKKKKGSKDKILIKEVWQEYLEHFSHIYQICVDLTREIMVNRIIKDISKIYVHLVETKKGFLIKEISLANSINKRATVFHWLHKEYSIYDPSKIERDIRHYLRKNKGLENEQYNVIIQKIQPEEQKPLE